MDESEKKELRRAERIPVDAKIEFYVDADIIPAEAIDVSQTGIAFDSPEPLVIEMRVTIDGEQEEHRARLAWVRLLPGGKMRYGLAFIEEKEW